MPGPQTFVLRKSKDLIDETFDVCAQPLSSKNTITTNILNVISSFYD